MNGRIRRYRPRIEGLFARIEGWSHVSLPSKDNQDIQADGLRPVGCLRVDTLAAWTGTA